MDYLDEDLDAGLKMTQAAIAYMGELSQVDHPFRNEIVNALQDKEMRIERLLKEELVYKKLGIDDASIGLALKNLILRLANLSIKE